MTDSWRYTGASLLFCFVAIAGCATNEIHRYTAYDKDDTAAGGVAYLHIPETIMVDEIDGRGRYYPLLEPFGSRYRGALIELLPGLHTANVIYHQQYGYTSRTTAVPFDLEAGRHYEIRASFTQVNYSPKIAFEVIVRPDSSLETTPPIAP